MYPATIYFWTPQTDVIELSGMYDPGYREERQNIIIHDQREFDSIGVRSCAPHFIADPFLQANCPKPHLLNQLNRESRGLLWRFDREMVVEMIPVILESIFFRAPTDKRRVGLEIRWLSQGAFVVGDPPKQIAIRQNA